MQVNIDKVEYEIVARRKTVKPNLQNIYKTEPRPQTKELDIFPYTDRTLIDYNKYHQYIGHAGVKYSMAIQATRGCPYKCFYCDIYKTSENHNRRSTKHFFDEVEGGMRCRDEIHYLPPALILNPIVNALSIAPKLKEIFDYRTQVLIDTFGELK